MQKLQNSYKDHSKLSSLLSRYTGDNGVDGSQTVRSRLDRVRRPLTALTQQVNMDDLDRQLK